MADITVAARIVLAGEVRETFDTRLRARTYGDVERMFYSGQITADEWEYFVHKWRTGAFRYSSLGSGSCAWCGQIHE